MKVGLLIIASEVLNGKIKDLNTHFLAEYLRLNHMELAEQLTVRDERESIHQGLNYLFKHCELVVTSGGVGPTKDDITKEALASYLKRQILYSKSAEKIATENYLRLGRDYPGREHAYSSLPEGFMALANPTGFAPGFFVEDNNKFIFSGPGVPRELKNMVQEHFPTLIFPRIKDRGVVDLIVVRTRKIPEEKIFQEIDPALWDKLSQFGDVSSLPVIYGVDITVKIKAENFAELESKKSDVLATMSASPLYPHIWHIGNESLEEVIVKKATALKVTFGFAESATGGLCSERITNIAGASQCFKGSVVCYDTSIKTSLLRVDPLTIETSGVVSIETAQEMASGAADVLQVDIALAITGLAGPGGGTAEIPVGTVCIACCIRGKVTAERFSFKGDRELLKNRFAQIALMTLLEGMEKLASH